MTGLKPSGVGWASAEGGRGRKKAGGAEAPSTPQHKPERYPQGPLPSRGDSKAPATEGGVGLFPACTPQTRGGLVLACPSPGCCIAACRACNA